MGRCILNLIMLLYLSVCLPVSCFLVYLFIDMCTPSNVYVAVKLDFLLDESIVMGIIDKEGI